MGIKISVITPSFNQGRFIEETILSVIHQNYDNFEYFVIDGGSTDDSVSIIKKYENDLTYWVSEKDGGQTEAINKGFKLATGDVVCWINSDDILMPGALKEVACFFESHKDIDFLNGYVMRIDKESKILFTHFIPPQKLYYARNGLYYVAQQGMFWRRELFDRLGYLDETFHAEMDKEFLIRILLNKCRVGYLRKILGAIRVYEDTKTALNGSIWQDDEFKLQQRYGDRLSFSEKKGIRSIYLADKLFHGILGLQYFFTLRWKGKSISDLIKSNAFYVIH